MTLLMMSAGVGLILSMLHVSQPVGLALCAVYAIAVTLFWSRPNR